jgi:uncharacterized membrane protein
MMQVLSRGSAQDSGCIMIHFGPALAARASDMSEHLFFMPVATQFQLALDMNLSFGAPAGHGHAYHAADYIGPWAEVSELPDCSPDKNV